MADFVKSISGPRMPTDGFDPDVPYQFIDLNGTRPMGVRTFERKTLIEVANPGICRMSNFRMVRQDVPNISPVPFPGPGSLVTSMALPAESIVSFTLHGVGEGSTKIRGRDHDVTGGRPPSEDFTLQVSVRSPKAKRFATCYAFDRINKDTGRRVDFRTMFKDINNAYESQASLKITNIDDSSDSAKIRSLVVDGSFGRGFDVNDIASLRRFADSFERAFPGVFHSVHATVVVMPVPLTPDGENTDLIGINRSLMRASDNRRFSVLFISSAAFREQQNLTSIVAHEMGHSMGLHHIPDRVRIPESERRKDEPDPDAFPFAERTLMFPFTFMRSMRLNMVQIELLHMDLRGISQESFVI